MVTGFSHVSIVVPDLARAIERLASIYDLIAGEIATNAAQGVRLVWVDLGNATLELMEPLDSQSPVAKFLERNPGGGIHHLCLRVEDLGVATPLLAQRGARTLGDGQAQHNVHGDRIAFVHPQSFFGALLELEEQRR